MRSKDHTKLQNNLEVSHAAMLQLSQSYMCGLFSALIGSSSGMGAGQAGLGLVLLCAPIIFSTGSLVLSNYLWSISTFALVVCRREYFETRCRGTLCRGFLCTSNFREQLLLQMPQSSQVVSSRSLSCAICGLTTHKLRFKTHPYSAAVYLTKNKPPGNLFFFQCPF